MTRQTIRVVSDLAEKRAVFALRYRVYVQEMGRAEPSADHERSELSDAYDDHATTVAAFDGARAVGSVRGIPAAYLSAEDVNFWRMKTAGAWFPAQSLCVTKFVVEPAQRSSLLPIRLCVKIFSVMYAKGFRFAYIDANEPRREFFEFLGFEAIGERTVHPRYGEVLIMVLRMADWDHFRRIRSPFRTTFSQLTADPSAAGVSLEEVRSRLEGTCTKEPV